MSAAPGTAARTAPDTAPGTAAPTATGDPVHPHVPAPAGERAAHWYPAQGLTHRGTVVLLPGRGEHPGVYERFGRRLAADAYVVHALDVRPGADPAGVAAAVDAVAEAAVAPLVLAGSDTGALLALAAAVRTTAPPHGLLLAGVPDGEARSAHAVPDGQAWSAAGAPELAGELAARTACPTHRGRLGADPLFTPGALAVPVPADLAAAAEAALGAPPAVPALVLHGAADPVSPPARARALADLLPGATLAVVTDGRHDTFNDIQHRSVAALVVQWLERLRSGGPPLLTVEGGAGF